MLDFFRGKYPWAKLIRLVDALPTSSYYRDRVLKDEDLAEWMLMQEQSSQSYSLPGEETVDLSFTEETPIYKALRDNNDLLRQLIYLTAANSNAQPPAPSPRPETALEKLRSERVDETLDDALMQLIGETW